MKDSFIKNLMVAAVTAGVVFVGTSFYYTNAITQGKYGETIYTEPFQKLEKVKSNIDKYYLYEYEEKDIEEGAIRGMLAALGDPYTTYLNKEQWERFHIDTEGEYEGVGLYLTFDTEKNLVYVITPIQGSPAAEAGILPGDYIEGVDELNVSNATLDELSDALKGKAGTETKVYFVRYDDEGKATRFEKTLMRKKIDLEPTEYKVIEGNIGYIKLTSFDENSYDKFNNAYHDLVNDKKVSGLIIDMRNNPGGLLSIAEKITDIIVPAGKMYYTIDKNENEVAAYSKAGKIEIPLAVIINGGSASATEIMTAAIKDYKVGTIVGTTSYGKGVVQQLKSLYDGTYMKVTISEYFSPNGVRINGVGVEPDVVVELPENVSNIYNITENQDTQLKAAITDVKNKINN